MMPEASRVSERAAKLRHDFDRSFALPSAVDRSMKADLIAIRMAGKGFAIRLSEVAGLFADKKIVRVPGAAPSMLGISGFRGAIVPVYDLHRLLGEPPIDASRWLVVAASAPVAFAFDAFDGQLRVPQDAIKPQDDQARQGLTRDLVQFDGLLRPVIQLSAALNAIKS